MFAGHPSPPSRPHAGMTTPRAKTRLSFTLHVIHAPSGQLAPGCPLCIVPVAGLYLTRPWWQWLPARAHVGTTPQRRLPKRSVRVGERDAGPEPALSRCEARRRTAFVMPPVQEPECTHPTPWSKHPQPTRRRCRRRSSDVGRIRQAALRISLNGAADSPRSGLAARSSTAPARRGRQPAGCDAHGAILCGLHRPSLPAMAWR
jgi:hypothetical protein